MNYRNAVYNQRGTIDCEIEHPEFGWIPTTLSPDDPPTAALFATVQAGQVDPYRVLVFAVDGVVQATNMKFSIPLGVPYIALDVSEVPQEPMETWEVDFSEPDGYGTGGVA
jgi:hypothetical protein